MFRNYFNVALRNLIKHKFYSLINILGLSIGLTCFLMISLFVVDELNYDNFHADTERIYRLDFSGNINGSEFITALASAPAGPTLPDEYPEVEESLRIRGSGNWTVKKKGTEDAYNEENVAFVDANFFTFWDYKLLDGDLQTCLERPNTLVMNESTARKVFGDEDPVGQTVVLDNDEDWEVTGVYEDMPSNSHFSLDMMLSMASREKRNPNFG